MNPVCVIQSEKSLTQAATSYVIPLLGHSAKGKTGEQQISDFEGLGEEIAAKGQKALRSLDGSLL